MTDPRELVAATLAAKFHPGRQGDPAEQSCMVSFLAGDGYMSIRSLTFGEVADALTGAGLTVVPLAQPMPEPATSHDKHSVRAAFGSRIVATWYRQARRTSITAGGILGFPTLDDARATGVALLSATDWAEHMEEPRDDATEH